LGAGKYIKQLGGETIVYGISGTIGRFINIFLVPLYTRVFSPSDFGVVSLVISIVTLLSIFVVLGLDNSSVRWFHDSEDSIRRRQIFSSWFWCQLLISGLAALLVILLARPIASALLGDMNYVPALRTASLLIPLGTFSKVVGVWMRVRRKPWLNTVYFTLTSLLTIGSIALFVLVLQQGVRGLFLGQVLAAIIAAVGAIIIFKDSINPAHVRKDILKEMLVYGFPLIPATIASWATASSDRFILQLFTTSSEVGIYSIAASLAAGMAIVTNSFQMAWGPFAFSILHLKNSSQVYAKVMSIFVLLGGFLGTGLSLFAPLLLQIFTTPPYHGAVSSIPFLVFAQLSIGLTYIFSIGTGIVKKSAPVAASIFIGAVTSVLLNFTLIPLIGRNGAAFANFAAYSLAAAFMYFSSQRYYRIPYKIKDLVITYFYAGTLIAFDRLFLPAEGAWVTLSRLGMCFSFFPLGMWLGLIRREHLERLWSTSSRFVQNSFHRMR
jgi:O-antigen/teichoic acid export membrane protein